MSDKKSLITPFAEQIASRQYFHKDDAGNPVEDYPGMLRRVAGHVARAEAIDAYKKDNGRYPEWYISFEGRKKNLLDLEELDNWIAKEGYTPLVKRWEDKFYSLMIAQKFSPGGRILAGSGSAYGQLLNCFVLGPNGRYITAAKDDADSIDGIYELSYKLAKVTKTGGGCGISLNFMRESGSYVQGSGGRSSGPVSFLRLNYNTTLRVIKLEGVRRGAGMATMKVSHPDVLDFVTAKDLDRELIEGKIEAFNISLLITDAFMNSVQKDEPHYFVSIISGEPVPPTPVLGKYHLPGETPTSVSGNPNEPATSKEIPLREDNGIPARWLWDEIVEHAWQTGDPGVIFVDRINQYWPFRQVLGEILATNPCGEQPLWAGESCCLGSIALDRYVNEGPLGVSFNWHDLREDVKTSIRFLDDVQTMNVHPIEDTQEWSDRLRRIGLGVMGDAVMMMKLGHGYASEQAMILRKDIAEFIRDVSIEASVKLGEEKGVFPLSSKVDHVPNLNRRNVHTLSIAPTGTISMVADTSSGIEPVFALAMQRAVGGDYKFRLDPNFEEYLRKHRHDINLDDETLFVQAEVVVATDARGNAVTQKQLVPEVIRDIMRNKGSIHGLDQHFSEEEQALFQTAHDVSPEDHVKVQAMWQTGMDSEEMAMASISKTVNMPQEATPEDVKRTYIQGWEQGLKGITMYRDGSRSGQVLRTDLKEEKKDEKVEELPEKPKPIVNEIGPASRVMAHRPRRTKGEMIKAEFRDATGRERKVYVYVGLDDDGIPVEVFITDEDGGHDVHPYAAALGKVISLALKYGAPPGKLADKLIKMEGGSVSFSGAVYQSVPAMVGKLLNEAVESALVELYGLDEDSDEYEEAMNKISAGKCAGECNMVSQSGCKVCTVCGFSVCM